MIKKMIVLIGAAACTGLVVIFVPGFAREIDAGVMPLSKIQLGIEDGGLVISPPDAACPHDPWPYGCDWRVSNWAKANCKEGSDSPSPLCADYGTLILSQNAGRGLVMEWRGLSET